MIMMIRRPHQPQQRHHQYAVRHTASSMQRMTVVVLLFSWHHSGSFTTTAAFPIIHQQRQRQQQPIMFHSAFTTTITTTTTTTTTMSHHHQYLQLLYRHRHRQLLLSSSSLKQQQRPAMTILSLSSSSLNNNNSSDDNNHHPETTTTLNEELNRILQVTSTTTTTTTVSSQSSSSSNSPLRQAIDFIQEHSETLTLNKSNWDSIFTCIEDMTAAISIIDDIDNNNNNNNNRNPNPNSSNSNARAVEFPIQSTIRQDMTDLYQLLATVPLSLSLSSSSSDNDEQSFTSPQLPQRLTTTGTDIATTTTTTTTTINNHNHREPTLRLFGAVSTTNPPASFIDVDDTLNAITNPNPNSNKNNNHIVSPQLFEQILQLPMSSLTPSSSNTLLYVGIGLAILEGLFSFYSGINYNLIVGGTVLYILLDRFFLNGISMETIFSMINPQLQQRIYHHEAGHFLVAYLLGCPIESIVVSAYAALQDPRYKDRTAFTAGTSFFDPILSEQMNASLPPMNGSRSSSSGGGGVTRSSIDRYSMIVMAGIAAEADQYGQADGGASDEYALIAFLSQLRSNSNKNNQQQQQPAGGTWNSESIRNQARYGAVQSMLLLRQYRPAYEALVSALQYGGTLKDCIYAIEQAGRIHHLPTQHDRPPMGYIRTITNGNINDEMSSTWTPNTPNATVKQNALVQ